jgi:hypothetical protein
MVLGLDQAPLLGEVGSSSIEAKYMVLTSGTKERIWLRRLLIEIQIMDSSEPTKLMCNNQSAMKLIKNLVFHDRTKHIAIRHHFIREKITKKDIEVVHVASSNQLANILTNPLGRTLFEKLKNELRMVHTIVYSTFEDFHIS